MIHEPVLLQPVLEYLRPARRDGTIVDATVGLGGHAAALLERYEGAHLIAIDRDPAALERARERLAKFGDRVTFAGSFLGFAWAFLYGYAAGYLVSRIYNALVARR